MIIVLLGLTIFLWFGGYLMTARFMSTTGVSGDDLEKIIIPPRWLYFICGAPVSNKYPRSTMRVAAFRTQMQGIFFGIYLLLYVILKPPFLESGFGFLLFAVIPLLVTPYISKRYAVRYRTGSRKGRK
jgi:hypothetical protein